MALYPSNGQPADGLGSDNDFAFDYKNRIFWGPKGIVTPGSWISTANSVQGAAGLGLINGNGNPSNNVGQIGGTYIDATNGNIWAKSSSGWAQQGALQSLYSPVLQGAGPPNASTAPTVAVGQMYFDNINNLMYGPSTTASYTGLTNVFNMVGPAGNTGPTTSYRHSVRGEWWRSVAFTAGTYYPICNVLSASDQSSSNQGYNINLAEPMYAAGSLTAITAFLNGSVAGVYSVQILKNAAVVYTATSLITATSGQATGVKVLPTTGLTFAAGDVITMNAASTTGTANQHLFVNLFYTTNS